MSELLPPGIENVRDIPYRWFEAIRMALVFLSFDELPNEERPPRSIWLQEDKLGAWFERVERDRDQKYGGGSGGGDTLLEGETVENKAAAGLLAGG